eukprot:COSAG03_NODE_12989_length_522_cov_1.217494_1_plen_152_part_01
MFVGAGRLTGDAVRRNAQFRSLFVDATNSTLHRSPGIERYGGPADGLAVGAAVAEWRMEVVEPLLASGSCSLDAQAGRVSLAGSSAPISLPFECVVLYCFLVCDGLSGGPAGAQFKRTALHNALSHSNGMPAARALLRAGARLDVADIAGHT